MISISRSFRRRSRGGGDGIGHGVTEQQADRVQMQATQSEFSRAAR